MEFKEAVKKVQSKKSVQSKIICKFGYNNTLILPYEEGMQLIAAFSKAERITEGYGKPTLIEPWNKEEVTFTYMSQDEYELRKIAQLLSMTYEEVKEASLVVD